MAVAGGQQRPRGAGWLRPRRETAPALSSWVLTLGLVLYLAFNDGGYPGGSAIAPYAQVSIVVWSIIAVCAAWGLLPASRPERSSRASILLFAGFTAWTALAITWSISRGRSFDDLALVSCYLGLLVLGVQIHRERGEALRRIVAAVATAIVIIAVISVASRLWPHLFSGSQLSQTECETLPGSCARLAWPINYWNGLAALMAIGLPLLLGLATSARARWLRSAAAAAVPVLALCGALTQSRGALVEAAVGLAVFLALAPQRATKLITYGITACGSALLVAYGLHEDAIKDNLGASHSHQAWLLALATVVICSGVGLAQAGAERLTAGISLPRLSPTPRQARIALAAAVAVLVVVGLAAHGPSHISHAWDSFKSPPGANTADHFAASGGEGRYQFWVAGIDSAKAHPFTGSGPGTFQLDYLPRATIPGDYVVYAHSLYVETYTELGLVGLLLLSAFLVTVLVVLVRQAMRTRAENRVRAAAAAAALAVFLMGAAIDWLWQLPAIVAVVLLLVGAGVAPHSGEVVRVIPDSQDGPASDAARSRWQLRGGWVRVITVVAALACIFAAAYPLDADQAILSSQAITNTKHALSTAAVDTAINDARHAVSVEPDSAAAQLQLAQSLTDAGRYRAAVTAARAATLDEPQGWSNWYLLGLLYAELGRDRAAKSAYARARSLNLADYPPS